MKPVSKSNGKKVTSSSNTNSVKTSKQTTTVKGKKTKPGGLLSNSSSKKGGQY